MAEENLPRVVIVGAGFGGLEAAKKLACENLQLIVIDRKTGKGTLIAPIAIDFVPGFGRGRRR